MSDRFYRFIANMGTNRPRALERARITGSREDNAILAGNYYGVGLIVETAQCFNPDCLKPLIPDAMFRGSEGTHPSPH